MSGLAEFVLKNRMVILIPHSVQLQFSPGRQAADQIVNISEIWFSTLVVNICLSLLVEISCTVEDIF